MRVRTTIVRGPVLGLAAVLAAGPVAAAEQVSPERLDQRLRRLENIIDSGQLARLIQRIDSLEQEIRGLRGQIEEQGHRLDQLRKRQRNLYGDLDRRLRESIALEQTLEARMAPLLRVVGCREYEWSGRPLGVASGRAGVPRAASASRST